MCGEKSVGVRVVNQFGGSPPRVRGKVSFLRYSRLEMRITPACAGKSLIRSPSIFSLPDHPRVCGEKSFAAWQDLGHSQSPPRVRGKASRDSPRARDGRITPACAGKRCLWKAQKRAPRDHPRVCGEKPFRGWTTQRGIGSPPRVRGKVFCSVARSGTFAITPACAGKSKPRFSTRERWEDHPRVCGEKSMISQVTPSGTGSPPRVRGKVR